MSDKVIMLCVVLAAVGVIAIIFIRRAMRYKKKALGAIVPEKEVIPEEETQPEPPPEEPSAREVYLSRFIHRKRDIFKSGKAISVRLEHHNLIRAITRVIGRNEISLAAYLDNVLKAHIDENMDTISRLYDERTEEILNENW